MFRDINSSRITTALREAVERGEKGLIPYIMAGDPSLDETVELAVAMDRAGADVLELGIPFSDPVADGPAIQAAAVRSLKSGTTVRGVLEAAREIRRRSDIPLVLMTYYNPVYQYGPEKFVQDAAGAGVNGMIVPDLPPEEACELLKSGDAYGVDLIPLVTPNTPAGRLRMIAGRVRGFVYCVSVTGVTGTRDRVAAGLSAMTSRVREQTVLPVAVGFGISTPKQARETAKFCDAVIVGSALVKMVADRAGVPDMVETVSRRVREFKNILSGREVNEVVAAL